jgi:hypothetical protein
MAKASDGLALDHGGLEATSGNRPVDPFWLSLDHSQRSSCPS